MNFLKLPGRAYDHVYINYGWWGVAFAGVGLVFFIVAVMVYFDRRR